MYFNNTQVGARSYMPIPDATELARCEWHFFVIKFSRFFSIFAVRESLSDEMRAELQRFPPADRGMVPEGRDTVAVSDDNRAQSLLRPRQTNFRFCAGELFAQ